MPMPTAHAPGSHAEAIDAGGRRIRFREKRAALSLSIDASTVYTYEKTGRLYGAFRAGVNYRRGMDHRILAKQGDGRSATGHTARVLSRDEGAAFLAAVYAEVAAACDALADASGETAGWRERMLAWTPERLAADGRRFETLYSPVGILPPDQYMALVVQTSHGCRWNRCTFCSFYRDVPFRLRPADEVAAHLEAVLDFLGEGVLLRRSVFLGDADALSGGATHAVRCADIVRAGLARRARSLEDAPFYGFAEVPSVLALSPRDLAGLKGAGFRRLTIGLETGHDPLRRSTVKRGTTEQARRAVGLLRGAGIPVGVVVLAGLGGAAASDAHVADTVEAVAGMGLQGDDLVYLSPMTDGLSPEREAASSERIRSEMARFRDGLSDLGAPVAVYDVQRFIY